MRRRIWRIAGFILCILPAVIAVLEHFPLWFSNGAQTLSVFALMLLSLAVLPFWRTLKTALRSPSAWVIWFGMWLLLSLFRSIIDGLIAVAFVAFPFSFLGALCFRMARKEEEHEK